MTDSKALIERLQNNAVPVEPNHVIVERAKVIQVIDHIEKLEADNARLREALEWYVAEDEKYIRAALGDKP